MGAQSTLSGAATILLVEDNEDNRIIYSTALMHSNYKVLIAVDGNAALQVAKVELPDLILMDVSIPFVDGWEVTRILKSTATTRHIPIIALTVHALESDRAKAFEVGCDDYLSKPALPGAVVAAVERVLLSRREPKR